MLLGFHLTSSGEQILLPSLTSDSNFRATKTHLVDWGKDAWPLAPWPEIKKKFLWIHEWAFLSILLQYSHPAEGNPGQKSHPGNIPPFYVSCPAVNSLLVSVQGCWYSTWDVMGHPCFLLVTVVYCEIYAFPLAKGLTPTADLIAQSNINLETRLRSTAEGKEKEGGLVDPTHSFQLRISPQDCWSDLGWFEKIVVFLCQIWHLPTSDGKDILYCCAALLHANSFSNSLPLQVNPIQIY